MIFKRKPRYAEFQQEMTLKQYRYVSQEYEHKLRELMGEAEFKEYMTQIARRIFLAEIEGMAESEFKNFCLDNFDFITR